MINYMYLFFAQNIRDIPVLVACC